MSIVKSKYESEAINLMVERKRQECIQSNKDFPLKEKMTELLKNLEKKIFENYIDNFFGKYKIYFITLNPVVDKSVFRKDIKDFSQKYQKREFCYSLWNFENFTKNGERLHSHGIIISLKKQGFKKYTKMTPSWLKGYSGFWNKRISQGKNSIHYEQINNLKDLKFRISYIHGNKRDKINLQLADRDRGFRKDKNLLHTYKYEDLKNFSSVSKYLNQLTNEAKEEWEIWNKNNINFKFKN